MSNVNALGHTFFVQILFVQIVVLPGVKITFLTFPIGGGNQEKCCNLYKCETPGKCSEILGFASKIRQNILKHD